MLFLALPLLFGYIESAGHLTVLCCHSSVLLSRPAIISIQCVGHHSGKLVDSGVLLSLVLPCPQQFIRRKGWRKVWVLTIVFV